MNSVYSTVTVFYVERIHNYYVMRIPVHYTQYKYCESYNVKLGYKIMTKLNNSIFCHLYKLYGLLVY